MSRPRGGRAEHQPPLGELLEEEAASHERVLELLRQQREAMIGGRSEELETVNRELLAAVENATASGQARARAQRTEQDSGGRALWGRLRHTSRLLQREAELNHSLAAEMLAQTELSLDLLTGTSSYGADGQRCVRGKDRGPDHRQGLLDQAA